MKKIFDSITVKKPGLSAFDLSHERKMTQQFGKLTPCLLQEVIPGDEFHCKTETLVRMQPMIAPIMERIDYYIHYFFIPNRILWDEWEDFITGGDDGTLAPTLPLIEIANIYRGGKGSLSDYFGLPLVTDNGEAEDYNVSALPYRAYNLIYNEYYRDEQLQTKVDITDINESSYFTPRTRAWGKDYFTSALPNAQKGPAVNVPVNGVVDFTYLGTSEVHEADGSLPQAGDLSANSTTGLLQSGGGNDNLSRIENIDEINVDAVGITLEELRNSSRLQEWLELANRGGSRLVELIKNYFGVHTGDARLDRPEYLGGGKTPITISEVLNTTGLIGESDPADPITGGASQGEMSGHGIATGANNKFHYKVKEHGYIMGIASIMPQATYSQGIERHWTRATKFDFYWPQFAHLGEQEVLNKELYWDFDNAVNEDTFGYQQKYAEYKYARNTNHGDFRDTLAFWTLAREFASTPNLNADFITCNDASLQSIFAVDDAGEDKFLVQMYHNLKARRPMPYFSKPQL